MIKCTCFIQEGQSPDRNRTGIQEGMSKFSSEAFGQDTEISWICVAAGNGFTASKPSTSSVVSMTAAETLDSQRREQMLRKLVAMWTTVTGCSVDEIVAVIADPIAS